MTEFNQIPLRRKTVIAVGLAIGAWVFGQPEVFGARGAFVLAFVLLGIAPAVIMRRAIRDNPSTFGLGLGDWKAGLFILIVGVPVAVLAGSGAADSAQFAGEYPLDPTLSLETKSFFPHAAFYLLYYIGFEFLFRGFLLLGAKGEVGVGRANLLQAVLATLYHLGKPAAEIAVAFPGSLLFGAVTIRTGSIWYGVVLHWVAGLALDWFLLSPG